MSYVDDAESQMTSVSVGQRGVLTLRIDDASGFKRRCPEQYEALIECVAFVNHRRIQGGEAPALALMLGDFFGQA